MKRFARGSTITLKATTFLDSTGAAVTPDSVSVYVDYPGVNRAREQATVALTDTDDEWTADWDSSVAYPGTVYCSLLAEGDDNFVIDSEFQLTGNLANPDP